MVTDGVRYLGSAIGTEDFVSSYIKEKVQEWQLELQLLTSVASTEPHAAYAAPTHGLQGRWTYLLCTLEFPAFQLDALDATVTQHLLPALTRK